ncbi:MAG: hypothetical protein IPN01_21800 [Deltaproteobacteria bacterium]|nr:hypothetical protein [Deltaproteobacteria bacterium]
MEVSTDARFVMFTGENAQGKTNLLEAVTPRRAQGFFGRGATASFCAMAKTRRR